MVSGYQHVLASQGQYQKYYLVAVVHKGNIENPIYFMLYTRAISEILFICCCTQGQYQKLYLFAVVHKGNIENCIYLLLCTRAILKIQVLEFCVCLCALVFFTYVNCVRLTSKKP